MTIEELFGTLQQSVVAGWRKHLRSAKYSKHIALQEFYEKIPDKVDDLIEAWMGAHGRKISNYVNIISSTNMNTLAYLKELRKVTKQGYALMNGEAELEALLDDIVELIDSTLYKVKELNECEMKELNEYKMKNLKDYINESLVCEAKNEYTLVWQHDNPARAILISEPYAKVSKITKDWDIELCEVKAKGNLIGVEWNDEWGYSWSVEGNNINTATRLEINHLEQELSIRNYNEEDGYIYIESKMFGMENEWWDLEEKPSSKEVFGWFKSIFDKSRVDGDSSSARAIIDLKKGEVVLGYKYVTIMSLKEFQDAYGDYEDEDYIKESLICEAKNEYTLAWQHYNPQSAVLINEPFAKISKITKDWDIELCEVKAKGNLIGVMWNDESGYSWAIEGNNINAATRLEIAHLEQELDKDAYLEEDGSLYIESKMFGMENEWYDMKKKPSGKDVFNMFKSIFDESRVGGDSSYARSIIDIKKGEVVLGYKGVTFMDLEEFQDIYGNYEDED